MYLHKIYSAWHTTGICKSSIRLASALKCSIRLASASPASDCHPLWKPSIRLSPTCLFSAIFQHPTGTYIKSPASDWHQHVYFMLNSSIWLASALKSSIWLTPTCLFSAKVQHPTSICIKVQHPTGTYIESLASDWHQHVYFLLKSNIRLTPTLKAQHPTNTNMFIFC